MLRAIWLTIGKEFRLILRDRVGLFMLLVAPIAVIAAAGFSLAKVYGGDSSAHGGYAIAMVDEDHGAVARAIVEALGKEPNLKIVNLQSRAEAEDIVRRQKLAAVAIVIAPSTTRAIEHGESARLILYSDPVKYLQTVKIELKISELCRALGVAAAERVRKQSDDFLRQVHNNLAAAKTSAERANADARHLAAQGESKRAAIAAEIRARVRRAIADAHDHAKSALDAELARIQLKIDTDTAAQQSRLDQLQNYLRRLAATHDQFEQWFANLKDIAGNRAAQIPPPPGFPSPPPELDFAKLKVKPPDLKAIRRNLENALQPPTAPITIELPQMAPPKIPQVEIPRIDPASRLAIPGSLSYLEVDRDGREIGAGGGFNSFDLQVPGFAVTFLLIGMLMGVSLALIDEHDWGTLERLRSASAPLWTTLTGKLLARFVVGFIQMIVLFAAGRALFGISLGRTPAALLMPAAAIAFAGAAFGLIVAGVGRTRDAVLPVGAIVIMTMAAVGGCFWPIDFEPPWMQQIALALPTTWTMRAFNDLMIRDLPAASALVPSAINFGFGILYTIIGVAVARRRFS